MTTMLLIILGLAGASRVTFRQEGSPTERVITLLEDLKTQVEEEGAAEAETYDKFACFCKTKTGSKTEDIIKGDTDITTLNGRLAELRGQVAQLSADIKKYTEDIGSLEEELAKATAIRDEENAVYNVEHADTVAALNALNSAIKHISGGKGGDAAGGKLIAIKQSLQSTMAMADALGVHVDGDDKLVSLLQQEPDEKMDYEFKSDGILDVLNGVLKEFEDRKSSLETEEEAALQSFEAASSAMNAEIIDYKASKDTAEEQLKTAEETIAEDEETLTETTALMNDDKTYLKDITGQCETKAKEWDQRSNARNGEITALTKALEIMGVANEKALASGSGGRTAPVGAASAEEGAVDDAAASVSAVDDAKGGKLFLSVDEDATKDASGDDYTDVAFFQKFVRKSGSASQMELRNRAITMLKADAQSLKSSAISLLTMRMAADPFAKVKTLIQGLIERLLQEARDEATHKGWCDTELGTAKKDRGYRHADAEKLNAQIAMLEANKVKLENTRDQLTEEIAKLETDLNDATVLRQSDAANNKQTLTDAGDGVVALKQALTVLKDFYRKAGRNKVFVDASPVNADMAADGVDGAQKGAYKGNQSAANGIIGMLETIKSDFERTLKNTAADEYQASRDFAAFSLESKASIAGKTKGLEQTNNSLMTTNGSLVASLNELRDNQQLLDESLKYLETLRPACVDTGMTWEEKVARRDAEIEALKKALCVLDEEDGEYADCAGGGKFFLQK